MIKNLISDDARAFLCTYASLVHDPRLFSPEAPYDRFRAQDNDTVWFNTPKGGVSVYLHYDTRRELLDIGFIMSITSGDHFLDEPGWQYVRENITRTHSFFPSKP